MALTLAPRRAGMAVIAGAVVASAIAALPVIYLVIRAFEGGWAPVERTLLRRRTLDLLLGSLELAALVTAASLVLGIGLAWLVVRTDLPARGVLRVVFALPLALPSYVAAFGWIGEFPGLAGRWGATIVLTTISYPYVYLPVAAALARVNPALEDVARSCGDGPLRTIVRVTLPQVRGPAVGGALLVSLYVLSDFGAVATMRHEVLTTSIFRSYRGSFDRTPAAVLGCVLALVAIIVVTIERRAARRSGRAVALAAPVRAQTIRPLGRWRWPVLGAVVAWLGIALGVPAVGMADWFRRGDARPDAGRFLSATLNTLQVGAIGAAVVIVLAFPLAWLAVHRRNPVSSIGIALAYAAHALPGVVVGLSLVFFGSQVARPIYQQLPLLVLAYVVLYLSLALGALQGAIAQVPRSLDGVARSLGRTAFGAWWSVTMRLILPGAGAAATLVFLTIMKELPATLFLRPTGFDTLATQLWSHSTSFSKSAAAPYAVAIVVLAALPTALLASAGSANRSSHPEETS